MDKFSKLGRKPKPPAIETSSIDRSRSVEPPIEETSAESLTPSKFSRMSGRMSPFRNMRLRTSSGKHARSSPPVPALQFQSCPTTPLSAVFQTGELPTDMPRALGPESNGNGGHAPAVPSFLAHSRKEIETKYQDLTWAERNRVAQSLRAEDESDSKWYVHKQIRRHETGPMDRYPNIRPWDYNRVKLQVPEGEVDYVNASKISLPPINSDAGREPLRYIAMQGPTPASFNYVWRMVAEQLPSPTAIVQVTSMMEGGFIKCHQYFPWTEEDPTWYLNEDDVWGDGWRATLTYDSMETSLDEAIEKRKLLLHVEGEDEPRVVWHFLYQSWPDFGVPELEDIGSFFELMRWSSECLPADGTRVVHCSAGVGRTGTLISLEYLMRELEAGTFANRDVYSDDGDAVFDIVDTLRQQRRGMVQGMPQYMFIHQVIRKLWQDKYDGNNSYFDIVQEPAPKRLEVPSLFISGEAYKGESSDTGSFGEESDGGAATS